MLSFRHSFTLSINGLVKYFIRPMSAHSSKTQLNHDTSPHVKAKDAAKRIVWVDLEMTGLNIEKDYIMEIGCLVTDAQLNVVATGPNIVIHQPDHVLKSMDQWCINQHGESGLTESCHKSNISIEEAEKQILQFVSSHVPEKKCPLAGNSVYMDRLFIRKYMPQLNEYLHYRVIDVSTIKELAKRWYQKDFSNIPQKKFSHRAVDDILESIEELKYYKEHIFKS
ncbi:probable oligoribonuclease [Leguminivora glycinivorella]|uniref:probable oligoribonuclease n=1 Tax=Leguminivora glycinivorella TaxID=1035111 RepID=UPI00200DABD1|nr:probable oligoribonuclease [Leguminivora glycinivorella]